MFASLSLPILIAIFLAAAGAVWFAGVRLSDATDTLSDRLGLGEALGGLILLAIATNLPEIAITASAVSAGALDVAVGNILGGIAIQTVVLALLDIACGPKVVLSYRVGSLVPALEGVLVVAVLVVAVMAAQLPERLTVARLDPGAVAIALLWIVGLWLLGKTRTGIPWRTTSDDPAEAERTADAGGADRESDGGILRPALVFAVGAVVTLAGGFVLERSGEAIAKGTGLSGPIFAATFLAAATALPEVSTGLEAIRLGDVELAFSDIFGGNAFLPVLFLEASLLSGRAVLPKAQASDLFLVGLGVLVTTVYLAGLVVRTSRQVWRLGLDSWVVLALYLVGIAGLIAVAHG